MAESFNTLKVIPQPFANNGTKNDIPATVDQTQGLASYSTGFPPITSQQISQGGKAPKRADFNGIIHELSSRDYFQQIGGVDEFNSSVSTAIGGYPLGAILTYKPANNGESFLIQSLENNNTNTPTGDDTDTHWKIVSVNPAYLQNKGYATLSANQTFTGNNAFSNNSIMTLTIKGTGIDTQQIPSSILFNSIDFIDKNNVRIGVVGSSVRTNGSYGTYLQARQIETFSCWIDSNGKKEYNPVQLISSYNNGSTGYNIWSNGYCEQWGKGNFPSGTNIESNITITLLKTYKDLNFNVLVQKGTGSNYARSMLACGIVSTNSIFSSYYDIESQAVVRDAFEYWWRTCGYLADGQY